MFEKMQIMPPAGILDFEKKLISCLLQSKEAFEKVIDDLEVDLFSEPIHKIIIRNIKSLHDESSEINLPTINKNLSGNDYYDSAGGSTYLYNVLYEYIPIADGVRVYLEKLQENKKLNELKSKFGDKTLFEVFNISDIDGTIDYISEQAESFKSNNVKQNIENDLNKFYHLNTDEIIKIHSESLAKSTIKTGFNKIDNSIKFSESDFRVFSRKEGKCHVRILEFFVPHNASRINFIEHCHGKNPFLYFLLIFSLILVFSS